MRLIIRAVKVFFKQFFKSLAVMIAFIFAAFFFVMLVALASKENGATAITGDNYIYQTGDETSKDKLLMIPIHGVILTEKGGEDFSTFFDTQLTYGYSIKDELVKAAEDEAIKGIFLHIDSPGGTVAGAKAIADGVEAYRQKTGKPVYAYIGGTAASGGYWAAAAADKVYADTGSSVGSIGVIFGPFKYYDTVTAEDGGILSGGVVTEKGIQTTYITAGRSKDIGNPYRQLSAEELTSLQQSVDDVYDVFVKHVGVRRGLSDTDVTQNLGAMIYSEKQGVDRKMIDGIANRDEVQTLLAKQANLEEGAYQYVTPVSSGTFVDSLLGVTQRWMPKQAVVSSGCAFSRVVMAYHGDIATLCQ
jgi:protease-4